MSQKPVYVTTPGTKPPDPEKKYWTDSCGRLVPEELVAPVDQLRTQLCRDAAHKADCLQRVMREMKTWLFSEVAALVNLVGEKYDVKIGGAKGNVSLVSFDGLIQVQVSVAKSIEFGESIHAAKALIDECLAEWTHDSRPELQVIVQDAFRVDAAGELSTSRILSLRKMPITDERWLRAMTAIADAVCVRGSKSYVRVRRRATPDAPWQMICLDIAAL